MAICVNCHQHSRHDVEVMSALTKMRIKSKPLVSHFTAGEWRRRKGLFAWARVGQSVCLSVTLCVVILAKKWAYLYDWLGPTTCDSLSCFRTVFSRVSGIIFISLFSSLPSPFRTIESASGKSANSAEAHDFQRTFCGAQSQQYDHFNRHIPAFGIIRRDVGWNISRFASQRCGNKIQCSLSWADDIRPSR